MKKSIFFLAVVILLSLTTALAQTPELKVEKISKGSVIAVELNNPAIFDLIITNDGPSDQFQIYSLLDVAMTPKEKFLLPHGNRTIEVIASPSKQIREKYAGGGFGFEYQLKGDDSGIFTDFISIKILPLKEIISIEPQPLHPSNTSATIVIRNKENAHIDDIVIELDSVFFSTKQVVSLGPYEKINFSVNLNKDGRERIIAGPYIVKGEIPTISKKVKVEGIIDYLEQEGTSIERKSEGFIINKKTVKKTNVGNTQIETEILIRKDIISRLFTINSPEPTRTERDPLSVSYIWTTTLAPNESFSVESTTNYTLPLVFLILIVLAGFLAKTYSQTPLSVNKRISFVKTKGGEFALKVNLRVKARKHVDRIQLIDTLPEMTRLYEKFGIRPDKIEEYSRRLFWNIKSLQAGEERVFSYIIYSKLNVVGRFELPPATAIFEHEGKTQEVWSNKVFFAAES